MMFSENKHGASADMTPSAAVPAYAVSGVSNGSEQLSPDEFTEIDKYAERRILWKIDIM